MPDSSYEAEQAVATAFHLMRSANKRDKHAAARDRVMEAVLARIEREEKERAISS